MSVHTLAASAARARRREQRGEFLRALLFRYEKHAPLLALLRAGLKLHGETIQRLLRSSAATRNGGRELLFDALLSDSDGLDCIESFMALHDLVEGAFGKHSEVRALLVDARQLAVDVGLRAPWTTGWALAVLLRHEQSQELLPESLALDRIELCPAAPHLVRRHTVGVSAEWELGHGSTNILRDRLHAAVDQEVDRISREPDVQGKPRYCPHRRATMGARKEDDVIERLKTAWLTPAAVALLLLGAFVLDSRAMAIVAAVLLVAGLIIVPRERMRGGMAATIAFVVAAGTVVILRLFR